MEVFLSSAREEAGEKSLKWAAIQRLPTGHRLRRGILTAENGEAKEVDIESLDEQQLKNLLDKLLNQDEDNEKFLMKLKDRFVRVGIEFPKIEAWMEGVNVDAEAYIGSRALPTLYHFTINFFEGLLNYCHIIKGKKKPFSILHDVSGIIKPGRTTLLLGPPGSGKTTLLLAMAGRLSSDVKLSGRVTYNGHGMDDFIPQRTSAYISQHDEHIGEMTVRETLAFSARCQGVGPRYEMLAELSRREKEANIKPDSDIDIFLKILGLEICADIMVGDEMRRGISGGQRKRVTVGLDSSTTFQIVNSIRQAIHILEATAVISLLQPAPETYELFEDIILLSDGQVAYQGPRENALEFFESMGFKCPERKGEADFLQEVTSRKDQEQYWANKDIPYAYVTVKEFADAFKSFHIGQKLGDELAIPFDKAKNHPAALTTTKYGVGKKELLKACISRESLLMQRGSAFYIFKMFQVIFMALLMMSLYVRTKKHRNTTMGAQIVMGALFFTMATIIFDKTISAIAFGKPQAVISEETLVEKHSGGKENPVEKHSDRKEKDIELSHNEKTSSGRLERGAEIQRSASSESSLAARSRRDGFNQNKKQGMVLPFEPLSITFDDISYAVDMPQEMKSEGVTENRLTLLKGLSGAFRPGVLTALMGVSGAGKSTLMDVLAGRKTGGYIEGSIMISGYPKKQETFACIAAPEVDITTKKWVLFCVGNRAMEMVSRSTQEEVDEESLKWAAIQRLPTERRIRRGILTEEDEEAKEVDIKSLGLQQLKNLLERLVKNGQEEDNEKFLLKLKNRFDRVGIEIPKIEVRFDSLNVDTEAYVGSRALPTLLNFTINFFEGLSNYFHIIQGRKKAFSILRDASGIIKPGRMTLLLGPPSSGKTTLLLALAGRLSSDLKFSGRVTYNGHGMEDFVPQRASAYISQHDEHIGEMTVRETLAFSARCQGVGPRYEMLAELSRREKEANIKPDPDIDILMKVRKVDSQRPGFTLMAVSLEGQEANVITEYILKILGLESCADTMVGDEMRRGISGGQRKRVTVGEMLVGPARALFMDEISTGLDSSTTFQIVNSLRQAIHTLEGTAVISLLQPAPETYDLFDDIILLSDGQVVYQGPRENALEFFESMGFKCPERKGVADFLQEVTSRKDQQQYWANKDIPYAYITVKEFADAFQSFHIGQKLGDELAIPFDKAKGHPAALTTKKYGVGKKELLKACISRELLLMKRNSFFYIFKMVQLIVVALLMMTLYLQTKKHRNTATGGQIVMGALFFTICTIMFNGFAELAMTILKLPVFYKQRDLLFYPSWSYAVPTWILKIPITFVEVAIWVSMTYYVGGFEPNFTRFLKQYFLLVCINQMASGLFRFIAALGRNMTVANTFGSFGLLLVIVLGGFVLSRDEVKKWWAWGYWLSPMMYGQNAIAVNEFLGKSWKHVLPNNTEPLGIMVLKSHGLFQEENWFWLGVGASIGFVFLFNFLFTLALSYLHPFGRPQAVISEENPVEKHSDGKEKYIELLHNEKTSSERGADFQSSLSSESSFAARSSSNEVNQNKKQGMVLPFEPLSITFDDISYAVDMHQGMKAQDVTENRLKLLKGVSGAFRPGVLTALMGVSGAGKTTLMDVLAGRKTGGYIEGSIMISGYTKKQETFARISGYCEQTDIHSPHITVYESLFYSAWLRLPLEVDNTTKKVMYLKSILEYKHNGYLLVLQAYYLCNTYCLPVVPYTLPYTV
ncbi:pleiotropic drug resistance protein 1 [Quercus suber]|uniref:Pleiotropic drug resistance protein 1 n=1 Tax=Quercus suber TaxID=58331 RepID=A0AAW0KK99_QUESU